MPRIIVDIRDGVDSCRALSCVGAVVAQGRVSKAAGRMHYCWLTTFIDGTRVATNRKRKDNSADSFIVYKIDAKAEEE